MFKFNIKDRVEKTLGYIFRGIVVSRYQVKGGNRYDVQVDAEPALQEIEILQEKYDIKDEDLTLLKNWVMNCQGMIHIFAESQLQLDEDLN